MAKKSWRKPLMTALKIVVSVGLLTWVLSRMEWSSLWEHWQKAEKGYLFLAFVSFVLSQWVSVFRFDLFIRKLGIRLSLANNIRLYALGMFYNFFIPGGVGGDAYKVMILKQNYKHSVKMLTSVVFFDRFIGLCATCILICFGVFFVPNPLGEFWNYTLLGIGVLSLLLGSFVLGKLFQTFASVFYPALGYSFVVQALQIGTVVFTLLALSPESDYSAYIVIFLISSVLSVISFAGIGIRETVFFYAATYMNFDPNVSAAVALVFSFITLISSLYGGLYLFKKIEFI